MKGSDSMEQNKPRNKRMQAGRVVLSTKARWIIARPGWRVSEPDK